MAKKQVSREAMIFLVVALAVVAFIAFGPLAIIGVPQQISGSHMTMYSEWESNQPNELTINIKADETNPFYMLCTDFSCTSMSRQFVFREVYVYMDGLMYLADYPQSPATGVIDVDVGPGFRLSKWSAPYKWCMENMQTSPMVHKCGVPNCSTGYYAWTSGVCCAVSPSSTGSCPSGSILSVKPTWTYNDAMCPTGVCNTTSKYCAIPAPVKGMPVLSLNLRNVPVGEHEIKVVIGAGAPQQLSYPGFTSTDLRNNCGGNAAIGPLTFTGTVFVSSEGEVGVVDPDTGEVDAGEEEYEVDPGPGDVDHSNPPADVCPTSMECPVGYSFDRALCKCVESKAITIGEDDLFGDFDVGDLGPVHIFGGAAVLIAAAYLVINRRSIIKRMK